MPTKVIKGKGKKGATGTIPKPPTPFSRRKGSVDKVAVKKFKHHTPSKEIAIQ